MYVYAQLVVISELKAELTPLYLHVFMNPSWIYLNHKTSSLRLLYQRRVQLSILLTTIRFRVLFSITLYTCSLSTPLLSSNH